MSTKYSPIQLSPFYAATQKLGAQFIERDSWRIPATYSSNEGLRAARERVAIADETSRGRITIEGQSAETIVRDMFNVSSCAICSGVAFDVGGSFSVAAGFVFCEHALR